MSTSYHMEALRRQRVIERAVAARLRMALAAQRAVESVEPPSVDPAEENKQSQQSNRTASAKSNRTLSQHSSLHSRASTAATLTPESQQLSPVGSAVPPDSRQLERPTSKRGSVAENNRELKEGSVHGSISVKREGERAKGNSREGSELSKRDTGTADKLGTGDRVITAEKTRTDDKIGTAEKTRTNDIIGEKPKSVTSSKRNSPIPEEVTATKEVPVDNVKQTDVSHHSSRKSNRPESHNKATNT